jgi:hypothetical protein
MRNVIASLGLIFSTLISIAPLHAQETTIKVGTAGNITATNSLAGNTTSESLSTAQVDSVLRIVAPSAFGQNFTRDKANKVFADFANFRTGLASSLAQTIANQPNIRRVNSVAINTNALNLRLSQKTNSVSGELGTIMASVSLVADVDGFGSLFCPSANVSFNVNNIKASGDYNFISGDVSNAAVVYEVTDVSAGCNGLLGFIGDAFGNPTAVARAQINSAIQSQINTQLSFVNMQRLFSLSDFANGLRYFGNETIISPLVNRAINVFRELVNDAAINTPGIVLNIGVQFASSAGTQNIISFIASHAPVNVTGVTLGRGPAIPGVISVEAPPFTERVDVYESLILDSAGSQITNWRYLGTALNGRWTATGALTGGRYMAIGRSSLIPGLESFPGIVVTKFERDPLGFPGTKK